MDSFLYFLGLDFLKKKKSEFLMCVIRSVGIASELLHRTTGINCDHVLKSFPLNTCLWYSYLASYPSDGSSHARRFACKVFFKINQHESRLNL